MKFLTLYIFFIIIVFTNTSCQKTEAVNNDERFIILNDPTIKTNPEWLKKGVDAWGLVVYTRDEKAMLGKPVHCEVLDVSLRGVRCKALEKVSLFDQLNCYKIGIEKDEIWFDAPQDIFKTQNDAEDFLKQHKLLLEL
ncbi:hypothetical protein ACE1ET_13775 [Saccharicrinis sp. FJH62]|uniref:hypothetical protein n=1 Tax=Saccharicrinis sp. FJH62 TaxID=3344657 RepID=UPI0035D46550